MEHDDSRLTAELIMVAGRVWGMRDRELQALGERLENRSIAAGGFEAHKVANISKDPAANVQGNGVAVVPISGMIVPKLTLMAWLMGADQGLDGVMNDVKSAVGNPDVKAVVLDIDSPGGVVDGVPEAAEDLRNLRVTGGKPIVAVSNTLAASAAYWLAAQAHEIVVTPSGEVGSVGVYQTHRDMSEAAAQAGVKFTLISAGQFKTDGNPYEPLSDTAREDAQQAVNDYYGMFVTAVANGRHNDVGTAEVDREAMANGTSYGGGRTYTAKRAVKAGLADRVGTLQDTISRLSSGRSKIRRSAEDGSGRTLVDSDVDEIVAALSAEDRDRLNNTDALHLLMAGD